MAGSPKRIVERGLEILSSPTMASRKTIKAMQAVTVNVNIGNITADNSVRTSVTVTGAQVGDAVLVVPPAALEANLVVGVPFVSAADTVQLELINPSAGAVDPGAADWTFILLR